MDILIKQDGRIGLEHNLLNDAVHTVPESTQAIAPPLTKHDTVGLLAPHWHNPDHRPDLSTVAA